MATPTPRGILSAPPRGILSAADGPPRGILSTVDGPPRGVVGGGMKILPSAKSAAPSRIAAGEDGKARQPPAARAEPELVLHKLLNANLELSTEELQRHLADQSDFTVIGVLGCQGVGKSTVMSLLAGAGWRSDEREPGRLRDPPFAPQTLETLLQGSHQTVGVDVTVTQERLILLDTQPLLSPSVLVELLRKESLPQEAQSAENLAELHSLRVAMLLLSVCHMVLILTLTLTLALTPTLALTLTLTLTLTTDHLF